MRGSLHEFSSWREPLTRPASLRFAGRPLPARERGEVRKQAPIARRALSAPSPRPFAEGLAPRAVLSERAPHPARLRYAATVDPPHRSQALAGRRVAPPALHSVRQSIPKEVPCLSCQLLPPSPRFAQRSGGEGSGVGGASASATRGESPSPARLRCASPDDLSPPRAGRGEPRSNFRPTQAIASGSVNPSGRYYRRPCARCRSIWPPS